MNLGTAVVLLIVIAIVVLALRATFSKKGSCNCHDGCQDCNAAKGCSLQNMVKSLEKYEK